MIDSEADPPKKLMEMARDVIRQIPELHAAVRRIGAAAVRDYKRPLRGPAVNLIRDVVERYGDGAAGEEALIALGQRNPYVMFALMSAGATPALRQAADEMWEDPLPPPTMSLGDDR
jgi:hypothetical protein